MICNPSIAEAAPADLDRLSALHAQALPPGWPRQSFEPYLNSPSAIFLKAQAGAELAGFIVIQAAADEAEVLTLAVRVDQRRQGYGRKLLQRAVVLSELKGTRRIFLEVADGNWPARALYSAEGFEDVATRKNYYQSGPSSPESAIIMRLDFGAKRQTPVKTECFDSHVDLASGKTL